MLLRGVPSDSDMWRDAAPLNDASRLLTLQHALTAMERDLAVRVEVAESIRAAAAEGGQVARKTSTEGLVTQSICYRAIDVITSKTGFEDVSSSGVWPSGLPLFIAILTLFFSVLHATHHTHTHSYSDGC